VSSTLRFRFDSVHASVYASCWFPVCVAAMRWAEMPCTFLFGEKELSDKDRVPYIKFESSFQPNRYPNIICATRP
jgi:hypothetical protein